MGLKHKVHPPTIKFLLEVCDKNPAGFLSDVHKNFGINSGPTLQTAILINILNSQTDKAGNALTWHSNRGIFSKKFRINHVSYIINEWCLYEQERYNRTADIRREGYGYFVKNHDTPRNRLRYRNFIRSTCLRLLGTNLVNGLDNLDHNHMIGSLALVGEPILYDMYD